jgi:acetyltransferase-like isoleucine patch superfamily enzyme
MDAEARSVAADYLRAACLRLRGAQLSPRVRVGARCEISRPGQLQAATRVVLEPQVVFKLGSPQACVALGAHVFVGRGTLFDLTAPLAVGEGTMFGPGCFVTDHNHGTAPGLPMWRQSPVQATVRIGTDCWLGVRATVLPGVTIGDGAIVAAGAVVTEDVPPNTVVGGVPARVLRMR